jgi:hypothetical protein
MFERFIAPFVALLYTHTQGLSLTHSLTLIHKYQFLRKKIFLYSAFDLLGSVQLIGHFLTYVQPKKKKLKTQQKQCGIIKTFKKSTSSFSLTHSFTVNFFKDKRKKIIIIIIIDR